MRNYDVIDLNDNIITECDGTINLIRTSKRLKPLQIGEYSISIWNLDIVNKLNIDVLELLRNYTLEDSYADLYNEINYNNFDIKKYKKIIILHTIVVSKEYRKSEIFNEFIKMIYRNYYSNDVGIIILAKPFQYNVIDEDYYRQHRNIRINDSTLVTANNYYSLDEFYDKKDRETNEFKVFNLVSKNGFKRIGESYLFQLES